MKLSKVLATIAASALTVSALAVSASAYTATLGYADGTWAAQDWASTCEVNGDGTYSITSNCVWDDEETGGTIGADGIGITVLVVDIAQLGADLGIDGTDDVAKFDTGAVTISDVTLTSGDKTFDLDQSLIVTGDVENKGNLRIEIYNAYGSTTVDQAYDASVSPLNPNDFSFLGDDQFTVSFTLSGLDAPAEDVAAAEDTTVADDTTIAEPIDTTTVVDTAAPTTDDKGNADTGVEGVAVVAGLALVATGAVIVSKKRK